MKTIVLFLLNVLLSGAGRVVMAVGRESKVVVGPQAVYCDSSLAVRLREQQRKTVKDWSTRRGKLGQ